MSTLSTSLKPELQRQAARNELPLNTLNQTHTACVVKSESSLRLRLDARGGEPQNFSDAWRVYTVYCLLVYWYLHALNFLSAQLLTFTCFPLP